MKNVLVVNAGSSSLKATLFRLPEGDLPVSPPEPVWQINETLADSSDAESCFRTLWEGPAAVVDGPDDIAAVGHRIVHGGDRFRDPVRITPAVHRQLAELADIAPEHNRRQTAMIEQAEATFSPRTPHIAVFDTAFHSTLPESAYVYGGPYEWLAMGIRRYGFHGLSHRYAVRRAAQMLGQPVSSTNLITCHLGNGCSLAAIRNGMSVDTTMGFTPLDGLVMGSRSGSVDPGILIHLQRKHQLNADELNRVLNKESGLKGLSGLSSDMRDVEAAKAHGNPRAILAFDCFIQQLCRQIGSMLAGVCLPHAIVFTGGIGENSAEVRQAACDRFVSLGTVIEREKNTRIEPDAEISASGARVRVLVVKAQENWEIARDVQKVLLGGDNVSA